MLIRQALCQFLQDRRVKVSLFLQDKTQKDDGTFVISHEGSVPEGGNVPGTVR